MKIDIITIGRLKESYLTAAQKEYLKRISPYANVNIIELPDEKAPENLSPAGMAQVLEKEAAKIEKYLDVGASVYKIALAIEGKQLSSIGFAETIEKLTVAGFSKFIFVIGGSLGLSPNILNKCQLKLSFSAMTFPHQLMRIILLEQIYRAFKIICNEPYHK